ncbi:XRE family transcriptional regulator [Streptomyces sp. NPDC005407]|uniref:XRE family transcriptional regulator n=1 Tax=Streptomyces sp. NPDC005407 TaxID=3155340 RepID=UPI00339E4A76
MSDAPAALAETVRRIASLAKDAGLLENDLLDVAGLSYDTGLPEDTVAALLNGEEVPAQPLKVRVSQRFQELRRTRLRPGDQKQYSLTQIAESFGATGPSLSAVANGEGLPSVTHLSGIQQFFQVHEGFLITEDAKALNEALQPVLKELERKADPWAAVSDKYGIRATVCRAEQLSDEHQAAVQASLAAIVEGLLSREGKKA